MSDAVYARERWVAAEMPLEQRAANGMSGVHPLRKALVEAETRLTRAVESYEKLSANRRPGRPVGATSAPDRPAAAPGRVKLKAVSSGGSG